MRSLKAWISRFTPIFLSAFVASTALGAQTIPDPSAYKVRLLEKGMVRKPILDTPDKVNFRTRLREAAQGKPEFAGRYAVPVWGCGTGCNRGAFVDLATGKVTMFPFALVTKTVCDGLEEGEDENWGPDFEYSVDSALIKFMGKFETYPENGWTDLTGGASGDHYFVFRDGTLRYLTSTFSKPCKTSPAPAAGSNSAATPLPKPAELEWRTCPIDRAIYKAANTEGGFPPDELRFSFAQNPDIPFRSQSIRNDEVNYASIRSEEMKITVNLNFSFQNNTGIRTAWGSIPVERFTDKMNQFYAKSGIEKHEIELSSTMWAVDEDYDAYEVPNRETKIPRVVIFPDFRSFMHSSNNGLISAGIRWGVFRLAGCAPTPLASPIKSDGSIAAKDLLGQWKDLVGKSARVEHCTVFGVGADKASCAVFDGGRRIGEVILPTESMNAESLKWALRTCSDFNFKGACSAAVTGTIASIDGSVAVKDAVLEH